MAVRTVTVDMLGRFGAYRAEARAAARDTRELKQELAGAATAAKAADGAVDDLGDQARVSARGVDQLGDEMAEATRDASKLDHEIDKVKASIRSLSAEYARTGDRSLFAQLKDAKKDLSTLQSIRRELDLIGEKAPTAAAAATVSRAAKTGAGGAQGGALSFQALPFNPITAALGASAAAGAAPTAFSAAGALVSAGAGLGAAGLGIAGAAATDPRIGQAWDQLITDIVGRWKRASRGFADPVLDAVHEIDHALDQLDLQGTLEAAVPFVKPLTDGVTRFVREFGAGFTDLVQHAGPVIDVLGYHIGAIGHAVSVMMHEIGDGSDGAARALNDILGFVEGLIIGVGKLIHLFSDLYGWIDRHPAFGSIVSSLAGLRQSSEGVAATMPQATKAMADFGDEVDDTGKAVVTFNGRLEQLFGATMSLSTANLNYLDSLDDLKEKLHENKGAWNVATEAGRENVRAVQSAIQEAYELRKSMLDSDKSQAEADAFFRQATAGILEQARAAGATDTVIRGLTASWLNFLSLPATKTMTVKVQEVGSRSVGGSGRAGTLLYQRWGGVVEHAEVGLLRDAAVYPAGSQPLYAFAEAGTKGEAFIPKAGDPARSVSIGRQAMAWYGHDVVPQAGRGAYYGGSSTVTVQHVHQIMLEARSLLEGFRAEIHAQGGDVQAVLGRG